MYWHIPIILASGSPRRHQLLQQVRIPHQQYAINVDESILPNESASVYIERMVKEKARKAICLNTLPKKCLIITADTIGVLSSGTILVKPQNLLAAKQIWKQMSGKKHQVWTAVQVSLYHEKQNIVWQKSQIVKTEVEFIKLTEADMLYYWQTGEPQDKAGGYAIQGQGGAWVKSIAGSYSNVVGLPLVETIELLKQGNLRA